MIMPTIDKYIIILLVFFLYIIIINYKASVLIRKVFFF